MEKELIFIEKAMLKKEQPEWFKKAVQEEKIVLYGQNPITRDEPRAYIQAKVGPGQVAFSQDALLMNEKGQIVIYARSLPIDI